jgi:hypothetical protein
MNIGTLYNENEVHYPNGDIKWIDEEGRAHLMRFKWPKNWPACNQGYIESLTFSPVDLLYVVLSPEEIPIDAVSRPSGGFAWKDENDVWNEIGPFYVNDAICEFRRYSCENFTNNTQSIFEQAVSFQRC